MSTEPKADEWTCQNTDAEDGSAYQIRPDERPSTVIVLAVAAESDQDPVELPPLGNVINPDALNRLFEHAEKAAAAETTVSLRYFGYDVCVRQDTVELRDSS